MPLALTEETGVLGRELMRVSKSGRAEVSGDWEDWEGLEGSVRLVIQNANGDGSKLNTRSELFLCIERVRDWVWVWVGGDREMTEDGMVNWDLAVSKMFT